MPVPVRLRQVSGINQGISRIIYALNRQIVTSESVIVIIKFIMEAILIKLSCSDNSVIKEGTIQLKQALKSVDSILALGTVIGTSQHKEIRQLAAVTMRNKFTRARYWHKMSIENKTILKQGLMQALIAEPEKCVKTAIAQVLGILLKHEFDSNNRWPELMPFVQNAVTSVNQSEKELGLFFLEVLSDMCPLPFYQNVEFFVSAIADNLSKTEYYETQVCVLSIKCLINFVKLIEGRQSMVNAFHALVPNVLAVTKALSRRYHERATTGLDLIYDLVDVAIHVVVSHIKLVVETCLELCFVESEDLQIKALYIITLLLEIKHKKIKQLDLVNPIIKVLFELMCKTSLDDNAADYFSSIEDADSPSCVALQTMDAMALYLPPDKLLSLLLQNYITPNLTDVDPRRRSAAYCCLATVSEGCSEYIRTRFIDKFVNCVMTGLRDPSHLVNNAALYAVGQFSEYLQPEISVYAPSLLPFLMEILELIKNKVNMSRQKIEQTFYALETFCENLSSGLIPFLPKLMDALIPLLSEPYPVEVRGYAMNLAGACATATTEGILPYSEVILNKLTIYMTDDQKPETQILQVKSVEALASFAESLGSEHFSHLANQTVVLGIKMIETTDDPELRKAIYELFACVSSVLKEDIAQFLDTIMTQMLNGVTIDTGLEEDSAENDNIFGSSSSSSDVTSEEEDLGLSSDVSYVDDGCKDKAFDEENSYLEEKEAAIIAIGQMVQNCPDAFNAFIPTSFEKIYNLRNHQDDDIKSAVISTLTQLCIGMHKTIQTTTPQEFAEMSTKAVDMVVSLCIVVIRTEQNRDLVAVALESVLALLKGGGKELLTEQHLNYIVSCVKDVFQFKTECQDEEVEDIDRSEHDHLLLESAGELIPQLGKTLDPARFEEYYKFFLPAFMQMATNQEYTSQRSFGIGMIADCMPNAGNCLQQYHSDLLQLLTAAMKDPMHEVRSNAVFALGELVLHGKDLMFPYYHLVLQALSSAVPNEVQPNVLDNFCGALARLIITNMSLVPLDQVVPVYIHYLPLREDHEENKWVYKSFLLLYQCGCSCLKQYIKVLIKASIHTLHLNQIESENQNIIVELLRSCFRDFPTEFEAVASEVDNDMLTTLRKCCS